jgi:hypothetical protein
MTIFLSYFSSDIDIEEYFLKKLIGQFVFFPSDIRFFQNIPINQLIKIRLAYYEPWWCCVECRELFEILVGSIPIQILPF